MCRLISYQFDERFPTESSQASEAESTNQPPPLNLSLNSDCKSMEFSSDEAPLETEEPNVSSILLPVMVPAFFPTYVPFPPLPAWPRNPMPAGEEKTETHEVLKPIPILPKDPVNGDGLAKGVPHIHLTTVRSIGRVANAKSMSRTKLGIFSGSNVSECATPVRCSAWNVRTYNGVTAITGRGAFTPNCARCSRCTRSMIWCTFITPVGFGCGHGRIAHMAAAPPVPSPTSRSAESS